jgi:thiamine-phosphate pyrophosphorylase
MSEVDHPQIYLITPPQFELSGFADDLGRILDSTDIACVRLALASDDLSEISKTADRLRETCHARDVSLVISEHAKLVETLGLDGVHLPRGGKSLRDVRKDLGDDAIIGVHAGASQHVGMIAGEAGADYVSFGPLADTGLGDGEVAPRDVFEWWSSVVEVPVVAEGNLSLDLVTEFAPVTDFFAFGTEIWSAPDGPDAALAAFLERIS